MAQKTDYEDSLTVSTHAKPKRGFAAMDAARQREIASAGGKAAHRKGTAHVFTAEEASAAGAKGGRPPGSKKNKNIQTSEDAVDTAPAPREREYMPGLSEE